MKKMIRVTWFDCDCDWITKYCEGAHKKSALIHPDVLEQYR